MNAIRVSGYLLAGCLLGLTGGVQSARAGMPQVYAGSSSSSSYLVDGCGTLNAWGRNASGCLGLGGYADTANPAAAPFPSGVQAWKAVAVAEGNGAWSYAIGDNGQLYGAGWLSFSSYSTYLTLIPPPAGVGGWAAVAASRLGWLAVSTNGPIYGNINGRVWWPPLPGATRWTQVAICSYMGLYQLELCALDDRGRLYGVYSGTAWFPSPGFTEIPVPSGATAWTNVVAGGNFVLAQANNGQLYSWGDNEIGQLGIGRTFYFTNALQKVPLPAGKSGWGGIAAGDRHALATTSDGQLYAWGYNGYGQLGLGDIHPDRYCSPTAVPNVTNVTSFAAGYAHSLAVVDCQVLGWGMNHGGQLGAGFTSSFYPQPIQAQFNYDICATTPPSLPLVSITVPDPEASQSTWLSNYVQSVTNTGRFEISRTLATAASLRVNFSVGGTAANGVDYLAIPSSVTIPAYSNSTSLLVVPTGGILAVNPASVVIHLLPDPAYQLGNSTNATVRLIQHESRPTPPEPVLTLQLFVGTNLNGQVFTIQSSTNLTDWSVIATATNVWGVVSFSETNWLSFRQRFFRAIPVSGGYYSEIR